MERLRLRRSQGSLERQPGGIRQPDCRSGQMTKAEFLDTLRRRLGGLPPAEIDELVGDYASHFEEGQAAGRSEAEIAAALGDPVRLARELRAEAGFRRWEEERTPASFFAVLFGLLGLIAVDFVFLLPLLGGLALFAFIAGLALLGLCLAGLVLMMKMFQLDHGFTLRNLRGASHVENAALGRRLGIGYRHRFAGPRLRPGRP